MPKSKCKMCKHNQYQHKNGKCTVEHRISKYFKAVCTCPEEQERTPPQRTIAEGEHKGTTEYFRQ